MKDMKNVKSIKNTYLGVSIVSILLGLFLVIKPEISLNIISYIIGGAFVFYGVVHVATYLLVKNESLYQYDLAKGLITAGIGAFFIFRPELIVSTLPFVLGLAILVNGVFSLQSAINMVRNTKGKSWIAVLIPAIVTVVLGILIIVNPFSWAKALLIIIGAGLIWNGLSNLLTNICISKKIKEFEKVTAPIDTTITDEKIQETKAE